MLTDYESRGAGSTTYKRIVIPQSGGPEALQVVEADLPQGPPGEVRLRVLTAGVLLADVMWQEGKMPIGPKLPFTAG